MGGGQGSNSRQSNPTGRSDPWLRSRGPAVVRERSFSGLAKAAAFGPPLAGPGVFRHDPIRPALMFGGNLGMISVICGRVRAHDVHVSIARFPNLSRAIRPAGRNLKQSLVPVAGLRDCYPGPHRRPTRLLAAAEQSALRFRRCTDRCVDSSALRRSLEVASDQSALTRTVPAIRLSDWRDRSRNRWELPSIFPSETKTEIRSCN